MMLKSQSYILILFLLIAFSCKKEQQSCSDGIFNPDYEEKMDCGGVCPPCDFTPTSIHDFVRVDMQGKYYSFSDYSIEKTQDWNLKFKNDSITVVLNLGDGDSLGVRPISANGSFVKVNTSNYSVNYSSLVDGISLFTDVNHTDYTLSGYFRAKLIAPGNPTDTLFLTNGEFKNVAW